MKFKPAKKINTNFNPQPTDTTVTVKTHKRNTTHPHTQPCPSRLQQRIDVLEDYVNELAEYIVNIRKDINEIKNASK